MIRYPILSLALALLVALAMPVNAPLAAEPVDPLATGFADPPASARPRTWWHWLNGNITEDGIEKDLAWMKRVGLGGVQNFDVDLATPQIVPERLAYMTPAWQHAFRVAVETASRNGLEFAIASSPGWSETGGPWVAPRDALKKLVWSESRVEGGRRVAGALPAPPAATGPFQSLAFHDALAGPPPPGAPPLPTYYADIAVLAFPDGTAGPESLPEMRSGEGRRLDAAALAGASLGAAAEVERGTPAQPGRLVATYSRPVTIASATLFIPGAVPAFGDPEYVPTLEVRDGAAWRRLAEFTLTDVPTTVSFAPVTGQEFRLSLTPNTRPKRIGLEPGAPGAIVVEIFPGAAPGATVRVGQFRLSAEPRVDAFEQKAGFAIAPDYYALRSSDDPERTGVAPSTIVDLTSRLKADGTLDWVPPAGHWRVLRLGYSLTGKSNHPAAREATGLEVDKYDRDVVRRYLTTYLDRYRDAVGAGSMGARGIAALVTDSIEVGPSNWTPALLERFQALRGYDPRPWLPVLTGTIVRSRRDSDAFLYDFRRTLADLISSDHYGTVAAVAHERGLKVYGEALEDERPLLGDDIAMRSYADVPMAALWSYTKGGAPRPTLLGDMKGASSVAHLYGRRAVAAESFTAAFAPWAHAPADLRRFVDLEFAYGINLPVIHTSVHQPLDDHEPGLSLAIFGQYFNRHETWAEMARPWIDYIARASFLLQQGRNVADVAYFFGEERPLTELYAHGPPADVPKDHAFDFVNATALADELSVVDGRLVTRSGVGYRALYLGGTSQRMTLPTLRRIAQLAIDGATVIGEPPVDSPALLDDRGEFARIVAKLWPGGTGTSIGRGRTVAATDVDAALRSVGVTPDVAPPAGAGAVLSVHRETADADIYFLANREARPVMAEFSFRSHGRAPALWHADTGRTEPVNYRADGERTIVSLAIAGEESVFVVFRGELPRVPPHVVPPVVTPLLSVAGPWQVDFQAHRGAPATATFATLKSLSESDVPGIRYFSGISTYTTNVVLPKRAHAGRHLELDLGAVGDVAEVRVNGRLAGTVWKSPYRVDIDAFVHPGRNAIEVRIANPWANRLIGDAQPGAEKVAFIVAPGYRPDAPLRRSGLIGPVQVLEVTP